MSILKSAFIQAVFSTVNPPSPPAGTSAFFWWARLYRAGMASTRLRQLGADRPTAGDDCCRGGLLSGREPVRFPPGQHGAGRRTAFSPQAAGPVEARGAAHRPYRYCRPGREVPTKNGAWFDECWQALETAERRGPYSLCESSVCGTGKHTTRWPGRRRDLPAR